MSTIKERYFEWGIEGGGECLYRYTTPGNGVLFIAFSNSITIDENDEEAWKQWDKQYTSFAEYWENYIKKRWWIHTLILFAHNEIKEFLISKIEEQQPFDREPFCLKENLAYLKGNIS